MRYPQATVIFVADFDSDTVYCSKCMELLKCDDEYTITPGMERNAVEHYGECPTETDILTAEEMDWQQVRDEAAWVELSNQITDWQDDLGWY